MFRTTFRGFRGIGLACGVLASAAAWLPLPVSAQGTIIIISPDRPVRMPRPIPTPQPPEQSYKIKEISVQAKLIDQVAQVQVSQSFVNTGSRQMEVSFVFPLPYDGAIDRMTLLVDGKEYPAQLLDAKAARSKYEAIVRSNKDPALLEWIGTGMFQTSVFPVPPGAERKVQLRYNQLCRKDRGLTDLMFPLSTAKYTSHPVETLHIQVNIESSQEVKNVYSPTHGVNVQRPDPQRAIVTYTASNVVPTGDFRLFYDIGDGKLSTRVLSWKPRDGEDGWFMVLASPQIAKADAPRIPKTVLFVLDKSGSMSGEKINQAKGALKFVLNNLREGDTFNLIAYDSEVSSFRPELEKFNEANRVAALGWVEGLYAGGGTNIDGALKTAFATLKDSTRPTYLLFCTDGLPTVGENNELKISDNARQRNNVRARLIGFGVGYDVNSRLLDRLARENFGQSEYVRPNDNLETQVAKVYAKIQSPVLTNVTVAVEFDTPLSPESGLPINRVYPKNVNDLFAGEQLVLVGRYKKAGRIKVKVSGKVGSEDHAFDFPADLVERSHDEGYSFIEKIWAMRRIGEIIDELDLRGRNEELVKELTELSVRHGILTPYTSFLADENADIRQVADNVARTRDNLAALDREASGQGGFTQRAGKKALQESAQAGERTEFRRKSDAAASAPGGAPPASAVAGPNAPFPGNFGGGGGRGLGAATRPTGQAAAEKGNADADWADRRDGEVTVQQIANRAFFLRAKDRRWVDSTVTEELEKNARRVVQFSPEYFALIEKLGKKLTPYLEIEGTLLVNVDGTAYLFDAAP